jgi:hypothetical protein
MNRLALLLAALWWGSLSTIGFLVVPLLFVHLPSPALAGATAARLFTAQTWVSLICGLLLLFLSRKKSSGAAPVIHQSAVLFVMGGMLLALLAEFAVAPRIMARENLALWHSLGSGMYLLQWLCAAVVFWKVSPQTQV